MEKFSYNISQQTIVNWYNQAMLGNTEAKYYVGMYESLYNDFRYGAEGHWYAAAKKGLAKAQFRIGNCGYFGNGISYDREEVKQWYEKAAAQGDADAKFGLELCRFADYEQAFLWCKDQAEAGVAEAQFILGLYYEYGSYVKPDRDESIKWFARAGEQGHVAANEWLAFVEYAKRNSKYSLWRSQDGMALLDRIDNENLEKLLYEIPDWNPYLSMDDLTVEYTDPCRIDLTETTDIDKELAVERQEEDEEPYWDWVWERYKDWWYGEQELDDIRIIRSSPYTYKTGLLKELEQLADTGDVNAMTQLYEICEKNFANHSWSTYWLRRIAEQGIPWAQALLAKRYQNGRGVEVNHAEAFKLFTALAEKGDKIGRFYLAEYYWFGNGVEQNVEEAIRLYELLEEKYPLEVMMKHSTLQNSVYVKLIEEALERLKDKPGPNDKNGSRPLFIRKTITHRD